MRLRHLQQGVQIPDIDQMVTVKDTLRGFGPGFQVTLSQLEEVLTAYGVDGAKLRGRVAKNLQQLGRDLKQLAWELNSSAARASRPVLNALATGGDRAAVETALQQAEAAGFGREAALQPAEDFLLMLYATGQTDTADQWRAALGGFIEVSDVEIDRTQVLPQLYNPNRPEVDADLHARLDHALDSGAITPAELQQGLAA